MKVEVGQSIKSFKPIRMFILFESENDIMNTFDCIKKDRYPIWIEEFTRILEKEALKQGIKI